MRNNISKNELPNGRAEEIQIEQLIKSFHLAAEYDDIRCLLKKIKKANIGSVLFGKPKRSDISQAVNQFYHLFRFSRSLAAFNTSECSLMQSLKLITNEVIEDNAIEDTLFDCLAIWVKDYCDEKPSFEFAKDIMAKFKTLNLFIDECERIGCALNKSEVSNG